MILLPSPFGRRVGEEGVAGGGETQALSPTLSQREKEKKEEPRHQRFGPTLKWNSRTKHKGQREPGNLDLSLCAFPWPTVLP